MREVATGCLASLALPSFPRFVSRLPWCHANAELREGIRDVWIAEVAPVPRAYLLQRCHHADRGETARLARGEFPVAVGRNQGIAGPHPAPQMQVIFKTDAFEGVVQ